MKVPFVDLYLQYLSIKDEIDHAIEQVIKQSAFIRGPFVESFNRNFAASHHFEHCIGVANGTDALYIIMKMLGIKEGDEVITTSLSWISTSESVSQTGARPVFVDIEPDCYTMDVSQIENKISPRTKAILPVHLYGHPADIIAIRSICEKHNLYLIEDCAQAHYAMVGDQFVGTFGIASEFSFYPGKNLGAYGDAGAIVTGNAELARKFQMYANHGALKKHFHDFEGVNSRLDGMQAAILDVKLKHIENWTEKRIRVAGIYSEMLSDVKEVILPVVRKNAKHVYHVYNIRAKRRDELRNYLGEHQIETAIHYPSALPNMPAYQYLGHKPSDFPVASDAVKNIVSLPLFPEITRQQIDFVVKTIREFYLSR